jgi:hypothetical protein
MRNVILFFAIIVTVSCSNDTKEYTIWHKGNKMTLKLASDHDFIQVGSLWKENDVSEYYGKWRYIDEENQVIETTIHGIVGGSIWTATPMDTFRLE